jgi:hypothetical protein
MNCHGCDKRKKIVWSLCLDCVDKEQAEEHQIKTELAEAKAEIRRLRTALEDAEINIMRAIRNAKTYGSAHR